MVLNGVRRESHLHNSGSSSTGTIFTVGVHDSEPGATDVLDDADAHSVWPGTVDGFVAAHLGAWAGLGGARSGAIGGWGSPQNSADEDVEPAY